MLFKGIVVLVVATVTFFKRLAKVSAALGVARFSYIRHTLTPARANIVNHMLGD